MLKKLLLVIFLIPVLFLVIAFASKDFIAKVLLINGIKKTTGLQATVKSVHVGVFDTSVSISDLIIFNPASFGDARMLYLPELYVDARLPDILKGSLSFGKIIIDLQEVAIMKDRQTHFNIEKISALLPAKQDKPAPLNIALFVIKIGKITYADLNKQPAETKEYVLNIDERFENVTKPDKLIQNLILKVLSQKGVFALNDAVSSMTGDVRGVLDNQVKQLKQQSLDGFQKVIQDGIGVLQGQGTEKKN
jgi:hypothetical protein